MDRIIVMMDFIPIFEKNAKFTYKIQFKYQL